MQIEQAVILAGGRGSRLRPLTDTLPKPMAPINDVPFMAYLLEQLQSQGIKKVILLTGYKGHLIKEYFSNGEQLNLEIRYSQGPIEWLTARRLWEARALIEDQFLLMYSDNFAQFNINKQLNLLNDQNDLCVLLSKKEQGNIMLNDEGKVLAYEKGVNKKEFQHVELGYMLVKKEPFFKYFTGENEDLSPIQSKIAANGRMSGFTVNDGYHSISNLTKLKTMAAYLKFKKIILLDRDGVINVKAPDGEYVERWADFVWKRDNIDGLIALSKKGYQFIVITNQAGIARKKVKACDLEHIHQSMISHMKTLGIDVLSVYVCKHHWDDDCNCRKPKAGLFAQVAKDFMLRMDQTLYIGDDPKDCKAASAANTKSIFIGEYSRLDALLPHEKPLYVANSILDALPVVEKYFHSCITDFQKLNLSQAVSQL